MLAAGSMPANSPAATQLRGFSRPTYKYCDPNCLEIPGPWHTMQMTHIDYMCKGFCPEWRIYMERKKLTWQTACLTAAIAAAVLSGCSALRPSLVEMPKSEAAVYPASAYAEAENTVRRLMAAAGSEEGPGLDPDFFRKHLNMDSFDELVRRTEAGIAATRSKAGLTAKEAQLWDDVISRKEVNQYTTDDIEGRIKELTDAMQAMANEAGETMQEMLKTRGFDVDEAMAFMARQAEKYRNVQEPSASMPSYTVPEITMPPEWNISMPDTAKTPLPDATEGSMPDTAENAMPNATEASLPNSAEPSDTSVGTVSAGRHAADQGVPANP